MLYIYNIQYIIYTTSGAYNIQTYKYIHRHLDTAYENYLYTMNISV